MTSLHIIKFSELFLFATNLRADCFSLMTYNGGCTLACFSCLLVAPAINCWSSRIFALFPSTNLCYSVEQSYICHSHHLPPFPCFRAYMLVLVFKLANLEPSVFSKTASNYPHKYFCPFWQGKHHKVQAHGSNYSVSVRAFLTTCTECMAQSW